MYILIDKAQKFINLFSSPLSFSKVQLRNLSRCRFDLGKKLDTS